VRRSLHDLFPQHPTASTWNLFLLPWHLSFRSCFSRAIVVYPHLNIVVIALRPHTSPKARCMRHPSKGVLHMVDDLTVLRDPQLTDQINKMEELLSQSSRAFLLGAGASCCAGLPPMLELSEAVESDPDLFSGTKDILTHVKKQFGGSATANIEDYMSEIIDALAIAERRLARGSTAATVTVDGKVFDGKSLRRALTEIKSSIAKVINEKRRGIDVHRKFVGVVHNALRAGKTSGPDGLGKRGRSAVKCRHYSDTLPWSVPNWKSLFRILQEPIGP